MNAKLKAKLKKIKVLILDVDGVLTDGSINLDKDGNEIKIFDVQDGFAIVLFKRAGYKVAIITARAAEAVSARAKDLQIDKVYQDAYPKTDAYRDLLKSWNIKDEEACFIGDDLPDLSVLRKVGFSVGVANAVAEVKKEVDYVTQSRGGAGAIREVIEMILKTQGVWQKIVKDF